jgi:N6-adenosine-specific RNA methylase IME4
VQPDSVQVIERTGHSEKPERFRELIDELYPTGKRVELFARTPPPPPWEGWGNEL